MGRLTGAPSARRGDETEDFHGERIADPYRWLERDGAETRAWTDLQNVRTRDALDAVPERSRFATRLRELLGVGLLGVPKPVAGRVFFERRSAGLAKLAVAAAGEFCATQPESRDPRRARRDIAQIAVEQCHGGRDIGDKPGRPVKGPVKRCGHT